MAKPLTFGQVDSVDGVDSEDKAEGASWNEKFTLVHNVHAVHRHVQQARLLSPPTTPASSR